ncbi:MAG: hypothetical protein ACM3IJ_01780 [Candidatus Levyibacteriota bacterium]
MNAFVKLFLPVIFFLFVIFFFVPKIQASYICFGGITNCFAGSGGICAGTGTSWSDLPMQNCIDAGNPPPPNTCNAAGDWQFIYYVCQIRQDPADPTGCDYQTVPNQYNCSAADACEGASTGGTGYADNGHVIAGHCSPGSYVEGNPSSACTAYGYYKQCCSAGGVNPPVACSNGGCVNGYNPPAFVTSCSTPNPPPGPPTNYTTAGNLYCSSGQINIDFSYSAGSGATSNYVVYGGSIPPSTVSNPPPGGVSLPSSPYTISGFSPNQKLYFNIYSCNSAGCTADPSGAYVIDIGDPCSGGSSTAPTATPTPSSSGCTSNCAGKNCGSVTDSCGNPVSCGTCTSPQTCGGSGTPGVCGGGSTSSCPQTCKAAFQIGTPCSGTQNWTLYSGYSGTCSSGFECAYCPSGGSTGTGCTANPNACVGKTCGSVWNGCTTITCGSCGAGVCTAAGTCVAPTATPTPIPKINIHGNFLDNTNAPLGLNIGQGATINGMAPSYQGVASFGTDNLTGGALGSYSVQALTPANYNVDSSTCIIPKGSLSCVHGGYVNSNPVSVSGLADGSTAEINFRYSPRTCSTTFSGSVVVDPATNDCSSVAALNGTLYPGFGQVSAFNGTAPAASTVNLSGGNYAGLTYAPICGSNAYLTLSGVSYPVIGVCDNNVYAAQSGYTYSYTNTSSPSVARSLTWLVSSQAPWYQVNTGDVRFPALSNKVPRNKNASVSGNSLFASSTGNVTLGAGNFPLTTNWQVNQEYSYNNDFASGLGSMSYSFYLSRALQRGLLTAKNNITTAPNIDLSVTSSGVYQTDGNLTVTASTGSIPAGRHIVLLVGGTTTVNSNIAIPTGQGILFVLASKGNLTFGPAVGGATNSSTTNADGYYTSEGSIIISGTNNCAVSADKRLNVGGALVANSLHPFATGGTGEVIIARNICSDNINYPTYYVSPRADFLLQLTDFYKVQYKTYKEVNP